MSKSLVREAIDAGEDYEIYPTTKEIIDCVIKDWWIRGKHDDGVYDIGAGNGKVLDAFNERFRRARIAIHRGKTGKEESLPDKEYMTLDTYAIEKSTVLVHHLVKNHMVIGTDFWEQSLMGITSGTVFCNPPYSEFVPWMLKILKAVSAPLIYFVVPERWKNNEDVLYELKQEGAQYRIIGNFDFFDAEDRKARAVVDVIRIETCTSESALFDRFFEEEYAEELAQHKKSSLEAQKELDREMTSTELETFQQLSFVEQAVVEYNRTREWYREAYRHAIVMPDRAMSAIGVSMSMLKTHLTTRMTDLRVEAWESFFSNFSTIRERLTRKHINSLQERYKTATQVEFTLQNAYAVLFWVLEHANSYADDQLVEIWWSLAYEGSIERYKSNQRVFVKNQWYKSVPRENSHFKLGYRIVKEHTGLCDGKCYRWEKNNITERSSEFLKDLWVALKILGYEMDFEDKRIEHHQGQEWGGSGKKEFFYDKQGEFILECRGFYNGNMHFRFAEDVLLRLNTTVGKILGWISSAEEAAEELDEPKAAAVFTKTHLITSEQILNLTHEPAHA